MSREHGDRVTTSTRAAWLPGQESTEVMMDRTA